MTLEDPNYPFIFYQTLIPEQWVFFPHLFEAKMIVYNHIVKP